MRLNPLLFFRRPFINLFYSRASLFTHFIPVLFKSFGSLSPSPSFHVRRIFSSNISFILSNIPSSSSSSSRVHRFSFRPICGASHQSCGAGRARRCGPHRTQQAHHITEAQDRIRGATTARAPTARCAGENAVVGRRRRRTRTGSKDKK